MKGDVADLHLVVAPATATSLQALGNGRILRIPLASLRAAAGRSSAIAGALWRECTLETMRVAEAVMNVGRRNSLARTAHLLCEVAWRYHDSPPGEAFRFRFTATQAAIADMLGLTAVHVNRMLRSLAHDGVMRMENSVVHVLEWRRLAKIAEFDPSYLSL